MSIYVPTVYEVSSQSISCIFMKYPLNSCTYIPPQFMKYPLNTFHMFMKYPHKLRTTTCTYVQPLFMKYPINQSHVILFAFKQRWHVIYFTCTRMHNANKDCPRAVLIERLFDLSAIRRLVLSTLRSLITVNHARCLTGQHGTVTTLAGHFGIGDHLLCHRLNLGFLARVHVNEPSHSCVNYKEINNKLKMNKPSLHSRCISRHLRPLHGTMHLNQLHVLSHTTTHRYFNQSHTLSMHDSTLCLSCHFNQ